MDDKYIDRIFAELQDLRSDLDDVISANKRLDELGQAINVLTERLTAIENPGHHD